MGRKDISNSIKNRIAEFAGSLFVSPKTVVFIVAVLIMMMLVSLMSSGIAAALAGLGGAAQAYQEQERLSLTATEYEICFFFRDKGYGDTQIAAVLGNLKQEKGDFDPACDNGNVLGIMQWSGGQRTRLIEWCNANGYSDRIYTIKAQLNYAYEVYIPGSWFFPQYDGDHAYPEAYNITYDEFLALEPKDVDLAAAGFCACCEKPYYKDANGNQSELNEHRIPFAREYLQILQGGCLDDAAYVTWAVGIANDPAHGYDQDNRDGPDYDCSSFVAYALRSAGYNVWIFDTDSEIGQLERIGFRRLPYAPSILQPGDILWTDGHTEICVGSNEVVGARQNESGGVKDSIPGDQTGDEISVCPIFMNFTYIFRLPEEQRTINRTSADEIP